MELIDVQEHASGFVKLIWRKSDGGIHMQGICPGEDIDLHLNAVNSDMQRRGLTQMKADEIARLRAEVQKVHTPEKIAVYREQRP